MRPPSARASAGARRTSLRASGSAALRVAAVERAAMASREDGYRPMPARFRDRISSCPRRRSGSARRTARNAGRRPRPSPSRGRSSARRRRRGPASCSCAGAVRCVRRSSSGSFGVKVMQSIGQMSTQASHSMQRFFSNTVSMSQLRQRCASLKPSSLVKPSSTSTFTLRSVTSFGACGTL